MFPGSWHGSRGSDLDGAEGEVFDGVEATFEDMVAKTV